MKKLLSIVLTVTMILSVIVLPTAITASAADNSFFGYEGGSVSVYAAKCGVSSEMAHTGSYSMKANSQDGWSIVNLPLCETSERSCGAWHPMVIDFWMYIGSGFQIDRLSANGSGSNLRVYTYNGSSNQSSWPSNKPGANIPIDSSYIGHWTHISVTFNNNLSGDDGKCPYLFIPYHGSGLGAPIYIDDVSVNSLAYGTYAGGAARTLIDSYDDDVNSNLIVPGVNGRTISEPAERVGYVFEGWYTENTYVNKVTAFANGVNTYYAKWSPCEDFEGSPVIVQHSTNPTTLSTEQAYSGTHSMKFEAAKSNGSVLGGARNVKTITTNTTYKVIFKYKTTEAPNINIKVYPIIANSDNVWQQLELSASYDFILPQEVTDGWVEGVFAFTTPGSLTNASSVWCDKLMFAVQAQGSPTSGITYFDNIIVTPLIGESVVSYNGNGVSVSRTWDIVTNGSGVPFTPPDNFMAFTGWYSDPECTSPISSVSSNVTAYAGWSKLYNGFEGGYTSAETAKKYTINTDTDYVHSGSQSLHFSGATAWANHCASVGMIEPGKTYLVDFWYYLPSTPSCPITFQGITYAGDNAWPMAANTIIVAGEENLFHAANAAGTVFPIRDWYVNCVGSWQHAKFLMVTDDNYPTYTTFGLNFIAVGNGTAELYIDDITLTEVEDGEQVVMVYGTYATPYNHAIPVITTVGTPINASFVDGIDDYVPSNKIFKGILGPESSAVTEVEAGTTNLWAYWDIGAASNGTTAYATVAESLAEASGNVSILKNVSGEASITVNANTALDLGGYSVTGGTGFVVNGSIKDTASVENKGVVNATNISFGNCTDYFPIYNNNTTGKGSGYSFYHAGMNSRVTADGNNLASGSGRVVFALKTGTKWNEERYGAFDILANGNAASKVKAVVEIHYTSGGVPQTLTYTYSDKKMLEYCNKTNNKAFSLTYRGVDTIEGRVTAVTKFVVYDGSGAAIGSFGATEQVLKES